MNDKNVILLRAVTSSGAMVKSSIYISPLFYNVQRRQVMELVAENCGKAWQGVALYIGTSDFGAGAIWRFGTLSKYLFTQDDFKDIKQCIYKREFYNGFC